MEKRKFKIIESRDKYITTYKVVNDKIYLIQEFRRLWWIFGKKKWRNFMVQQYDVMSRVDFSNLKEAEGYLKCLRDYYGK